MTRRFMSCAIMIPAPSLGQEQSILIKTYLSVAPVALLAPCVAVQNVQECAIKGMTVSSRKLHQQRIVIAGKNVNAKL